MGKLLIGADPEFFVRRGRHWISGHTFDCGTKSDPMQTANGSVQVDGIALECNVIPAETPEGFVLNCRAVMEDLSDIVTIVDAKARLAIRPSIFLGRRFLQSLPETARELGCTPDYNAYTGRTNSRPSSDSVIRTGSGHIHLGWTQNEEPRSVAHFTTCTRLVRELDYFVGLQSLNWDSDSRRRLLYGRAGAFRPKPYGCEYRVLSNAWLADDSLMRLVFTASQNAYESARGSNSMGDRFGDTAREIIDNGVVDWKSDFPDIAEALNAG